MALIALDFPALERPTKATSGAACGWQVAQLVEGGDEVDVVDDGHKASWNAILVKVRRVAPALTGMRRMN